MKETLTITVAILSLSAPAIAQDKNDWQSWPLADRFAISLDAFFPNLDTVVRLDASDGSIGSTVSFEQNLGMSDTEALPGITLDWRFAKKHKLAMNFFNLNRSGSSIVGTEIRFGDKTFTADLPISSFFDMKVTSLSYKYSFIFDERKELAICLGISVQDIKFGLQGNLGLGLVQSQSGLTAPVPTIGLQGGYAFTEKWIGKIGANAISFDLALDGEKALSGQVLAAVASIQHNTFEHVYFGLNYSYFDVGVSFQKNGLETSLNYKYRGPMLTVTAAF